MKTIEEIFEILNINLQKLNLEDNDTIIVELENMEKISEEELYRALLMLQEKLDELYPNINFMFLPKNIKAYFGKATIEDIDDMIKQLQLVKANIQILS